MRDLSSRPRRQPMGRLELVALVAGGVALAGASWAATDAWSDWQATRVRVEAARRDAEAARVRTQALEARAGADQQLAWQALHTAEAPPPRVASDLALLLPADVRLESLTLTYGRTLDVEMQVAARHAAAYDVFLERLERSAVFTGVLPGDENRQGEVRASIRATYRSAGT